MVTNNKTGQEKINEKIRLDLSYINYSNIIDMGLPYKFSYLDEWLLKKSKILTKEASTINNNEIKNYRTYKRGTIIKADFGIGIGSEMSQVHFAIVLNNYDNPKNNVLTVIPLTSKESKYNINLKELIINELIIKTETKLKEYSINLSEIDMIKRKKLQTLNEYYKTYMKNTYACPSLITTISKERIFPPVNEYDLIGKSKCSKEQMKIIDNEIQNRFSTQ